ncbi:hypothetical protein [Corynebacterium amycolatum]|uniref:hypothetical protein n=1 Tax=Corynebacterium amycolatum TaxID=43765 RepID=UPI0011776D53|nr:hypothetical protein [Corynebacterium amycolatum]
MELKAAIGNTRIDANESEITITNTDNDTSVSIPYRAVGTVVEVLELADRCIAPFTHPWGTRAAPWSDTSIKADK